MIAKERLVALMEIKGRLAKMDNRKLAWLIANSCLMDFEIGTPEAELVQAAVERLFPEWDEETVLITPRGWQTPEGEIIYLKDVKIDPDNAATKGE